MLTAGETGKKSHKVMKNTSEETQESTERSDVTAPNPRSMSTPGKRQDNCVNCRIYKERGKDLKTVAVRCSLDTFLSAHRWNFADAEECGSCASVAVSSPLPWLSSLSASCHWLHRVLPFPTNFHCCFIYYTSTLARLTSSVSQLAASRFHILFYTPSSIHSTNTLYIKGKCLLLNQTAASLFV